MARASRWLVVVFALFPLLIRGADGTAVAERPALLPRPLGANEAGARTDALKSAPAAAEDIGPLPVPYYSQRDERWGCSQLGTCVCDLSTCTSQSVTTIADAGCYPTSQAMVFAYYAGGGFLDPGQYNECLIANQGYTAFPGACSNGVCGAIDDPPAGCRPAGLQYLGPSLDKAVLDEDLRSGHPAIAVTAVGVPGRLPHAVVVIGKRGGNYLVNDPYYAVSEMSADAIYGFHRWAGSVPVAAAAALPQAGAAVEAPQTAAPPETTGAHAQSPATAAAGQSPSAETTSRLDSSYVRDVTVPDGTPVPSSHPFAKVWAVRNSGNTSWPQGTRLMRLGGAVLGTRAVMAVPALAPGETARIWAPMRSPVDARTPLREEWRLATPEGALFGDTLTVEVTVTGPARRRASNWSMFEVARRIPAGPSEHPRPG